MAQIAPWLRPADMDQMSKGSSAGAQLRSIRETAKASIRNNATRLAQIAASRQGQQAAIQAGRERDSARLGLAREEMKAQQGLQQEKLGMSEQLLNQRKAEFGAEQETEWTPMSTAKGVVLVNKKGEVKMATPEDVAAAEGDTRQADFVYDATKGATPFVPKKKRGGA